MSGRVSSLARVRSLVEALLQEGSSPELADVLHERLHEQWHGFQGFDTGRALEWREFWPVAPDTVSVSVLTLPTEDADKLLQGLTADVTTYQWVTPQHAIIARPEVPYHAWVEEGQVWLGDDAAQLQRLARRQPGVMPAADEVAQLDWDFAQVPLSTRSAILTPWVQSVAAAVQSSDQTAPHLSQLLRTYGPLLVRGIQSLDEDLLQARVSLRWDEPGQALKLQAVANAAARSSLAQAFQLLRSEESPELAAALSENVTTLLSGRLSLPAAGTERNATGFTVRFSLIQLVGATRVFVLHCQSAAGILRSDADPNPAPPERITLGDEHLSWRRLLRVAASGWTVKDATGVWIVVGAEHVAGVTLERCRSHAVIPAADPRAITLSLKMTPSFLASLLDESAITGPPGALPAEKFIELRPFRTERSDGGRVAAGLELTLPAEAFALLIAPLAEELNAEVEARLRP